MMIVKTKVSENKVLLQTKKCPDCSAKKPVSEFFRSSSKKDGYQTSCKECQRKYRAEYRKSPQVREKEKAKNLEWVRSEKGQKARNKYFKKTYAARKESGICAQCGKENAVSGKINCSDCANKVVVRTMKKIQSRGENQQCYLCEEGTKDNLILRKMTICKLCYFKERASSNLGSQNFWLVLKDKLEEQNYRCAYSGETLILGVNAEVDHILPRATFPHLANDPKNIQWVTRDVNQMKRALLPERFLQIIENICKFKNQ